jgi:Domain of unknown function (DUF4386)
MSLASAERLPLNAVARVTGGFYLAFIAATVLGDLLGHIGIGEASQVHQTIAEDPGVFKVGFVFVLLTGLLFVLAAWGLYVLLRRVNSDLALLFLILNAVGVAIQGASMLGLVAASWLGDPASDTSALSGAELTSLSYMSLNVYQLGFVTAQLFFGAWLFPLGYLVYKSGFLPRFLGALLLLDGVGVLIWFFQALLLPDYEAIIYPGLVVSFIAEVGLGLWLLLMGVKTVDARAAQQAPSEAGG